MTKKICIINKDNYIKPILNYLSILLLFISITVNAHAAGTTTLDEDEEEISLVELEKRNPDAYEAYHKALIDARTEDANIETHRHTIIHNKKTNNAHIYVEHLDKNGDVVSDQQHLYDHKTQSLQTSLGKKSSPLSQYKPIHDSFQNPSSLTNKEIVTETHIDAAVTKHKELKKHLLERLLETEKTFLKNGVRLKVTAEELTKLRDTLNAIKTNIGTITEDKNEQKKLIEKIDERYKELGMMIVINDILYQQKYIEMWNKQISVQQKVISNNKNNNTFLDDSLNLQTGLGSTGSNKYKGSEAPEFKKNPMSLSGKAFFDKDGNVTYVTVTFIEGLRKRGHSNETILQFNYGDSALSDPLIKFRDILPKTQKGLQRLKKSSSIEAWSKKANIIPQKSYITNFRDTLNKTLRGWYKNFTESSQSSDTNTATSKQNTATETGTSTNNTAQKGKKASEQDKPKDERHWYDPITRIFG